MFRGTPSGKRRGTYRERSHVNNAVMFLWQSWRIVGFAAHTVGLSIGGVSLVKTVADDSGGVYPGRLPYRGSLGGKCVVGRLAVVLWVILIGGET